MSAPRLMLTAAFDPDGHNLGQIIHLETDAAREYAIARLSGHLPDEADSYETLPLRDFVADDEETILILGDD